MGGTVTLSLSENFLCLIRPAFHNEGRNEDTKSSFSIVLSLSGLPHVKLDTSPRL